MLTRHLRINMANGRFLPQDGNHPVHVHRAVKLRIDHPEVFVEWALHAEGRTLGQGGASLG
jgi:hypothetical protein